MDQSSVENFLNEEIKGAEHAVRKMLFYYILALQSSGIEDVKQYIATRIGDIINLSDEQTKFVLANLNNENKLIDNLDNSIKLLKKMKDENKLDIESINIIIKVLELIIKDYGEIKYDKQ